jgi:hypothetical protein
MLKKEFRDTLRILIESALLMLSIPLILLVAWIFDLEAPPGDLLSGTYILTFFVFAGYSGIALFKTEKRDKGFEYLFTLPLPRIKILLYKIVPRLAVLILLSMPVFMIFDFTFNGTAVPGFLLFFGCVCLSLAFESYLVGIIAVILFVFFYSLSQRFISVGLFLLTSKTYLFTRSLSASTIALLILCIPLVISFLMVLKKMDLKPYKYIVKPYIKVMLPVILVHIIIFLLYYNQVYNFYYIY